MKLTGYIKEIKENSFAIPIYSDEEGKFYFHNLNNLFFITEFIEVSIDSNLLVEIYFNKDFDQGTKGAMVFVGEDKYIMYDFADLVAEDIIIYLDTKAKKKCNNVKREIQDVYHDVITHVIKPKKNNSDLQFYRHNGFGVDLINHNKEMNDEGIIKYSLKEYTELENDILNSKPLISNNLNIVANELKHVLLKELGFNRIKEEVIFFYFEKFISQNDSKIFDEVFIFNFSNFLSGGKFEEPSIMTTEETLKYRADERRAKAKAFNYKFHNNPSKIDELEKMPAYMRLGVVLDDIHSEEDKAKRNVVHFLKNHMPEEGHTNPKDILKSQDKSIKK